MFAVLQTGGKQYKVARNDVITVEKLAAEPGSEVELDQVLLVGQDGGSPRVGAPTVDGARVTAEVLEQTRGRKITVFKKKRRQGYRRTHGHRQHQTVLRITDIAVDGAKASETDASAPTPRQSPQQLREATNAGLNARNKAKARTARQRNTVFDTTLPGGGAEADDEA
ncbi:LSU ribosomal protein L21P [Limimonas halophila]|uniref:Large ribosomal subunit protein bL21 n=1 Tax=Limimonas halophila TaxID=1082479 RepID=A0A1G7TIW7_9PROT|nr:LSU ribosomal protein L21P [Limimonas halophila]